MGSQKNYLDEMFLLSIQNIYMNKKMHVVTILLPESKLSVLTSAEHSGSLGRALDWGLKGCWFEFHHRRSHRIVYALNPLLSTGSTQEDLSPHG